MSGNGLWLDLTGVGLEGLAVALGAWVVGDNWVERVRQSQEDKRVGAWPQVGEVEWPQVEEAEQPTEAEEILATFSSPVLDRICGAGTNLVARTRQATSGHRWIQFASIACVKLFLTCLALVLFVPLVLISVFAYASDSRYDVRLRIIVGLFPVGIVFQVIANV